MWPIPGPDMRASVIVFLTDQLGLGPSFLAEAGPFMVERHYTPRNPTQEEAVVFFRNPNVRDAVKSASINLAGKSAGVRIHLPVHLRANFRHLDSLIFELKKKHPNLKRGIKFNDDDLDILADVRLDEGKKWRRLLPAAARETRVGMTANSASDPANSDSENLTAEDLTALLSNGAGSS